ncbi:hypothetical protein V6N13_083715 [Hibiscus sabdariffa]
MLQQGKGYGGAVQATLSPGAQGVAQPQADLASATKVSSVDHTGSNVSRPIDDNVTVLTPQPRGAHPDGGCVGTVVHTTNSVLPASPRVDTQLRVSSPIMQSPELTDGSSASGTRLRSHVVDDSHVSLPPDVPSQISSESVLVDEGQSPLEDGVLEDMSLTVNKHSMINRSKAGAS